MEWRVVPSFDCYEVSEFGQVRRCKPGIIGGQIGKVMKPYVREDGYDMYILRKNNQSFHKKAHQLVIEAFVLEKPKEGRWEVRHKDGTRTNNHYSNLEWGTSKDNKADMVRHGTRLCGEKSAQAKLTRLQVDEIREARRNNPTLSMRVIGEKYGVAWSCIWKIVNNKRWAA